MVQKRALLIGLNYPGTSHALNGCINDVVALKDVLVKRFGFPEQNITLLLDTEGPVKPTLEAILSNLDKKIQETQPGDVLFLHYSGHGTQIPDDEREEGDGKDEALVTADGAPLRDDVLQAAFAKLPENVKFTFIADCCHSGTMLDQPKQAISGDKNASVQGVPSDAREVKHRGLNFGQFKSLAGELSRDGFNIDAVSSLLGGSGGGDVGNLVGGLLGAVAGGGGGGGGGNVPISSFLGFLNQNRPVKPSAPPPNLESAVLISGCQDNETSADAYINGQYNGALTNALVTVLGTIQGAISNKDITVKVREFLKEKGYAQNPCLSCSDSQVDKPFIA